MITRSKHSRLFAKQKHASWWFILSLLLSFASMLADYHDHSMRSVRRAMSALIAPLQFAVDYPGRMIGWSHSLMSSKKMLINENMQLRYQQTVLESQLQKFLALRNENVELKGLLSASSSDKYHTMAAQILAVDTSNVRQVVIISKGSREGVALGQAVVDAKGVMGQVIDVGVLTSTVLLISDAKCAVPVLNQRTGERAILVGTNNIGRLSLVNLPTTSMVAAGDLLVTSGLGGHYPEGYPVGFVDSVQPIAGDDFIRIMVSPVAWLSRSRLVLLISPEEQHSEMSMQIQERLQVLEEIN